MKMALKLLSRIVKISLLLLIINGCTVKHRIELEGCPKNFNFSSEERLKNYPFNNSENIVFISYTQKQPGLIGTELSKYLSKLYKKTKKFEPEDVNEAYYLGKEDINELTDVFYNYGYNKGNITVSSSGCYMPKNAILFLDSEDYLSDYIEICFECGVVKFSNEKMNLGYNCSDKLGLIKKLFEKYNIKYLKLEDQRSTN
ncbi:hypothetical protein EB1_34860 [Empedobacter brevis NBRC 14943 = ATCC 43319]|uniref:Uncharacterized protein n=2 Tax=Empedobacter brevis TaxID=247 RepID=A0A511NLS4_9FLAO|nr:hypothetical protein [Empedobacter brevis]GEM53696.1 hypothetical protein EB1_34860 [Empedobacter brevis NBRC 14943 = ATCC 43319]